MPIPYFKPVRGKRPQPLIREMGRRWERARKEKSWKKRFLALWFPITVILILVGGIMLVAAFAWFSRDLPDPDKIIDRTLAESTKIYARDGSTLLYEVHGEQKRTVINLEDIPEHARWATIVVEDKDFYTHKGFNLRRIIASVIIDVIKGRKAQGASTITQQFVKNAILTTEKSYTRKIRELILAYQIERKFSKDQILKLYFNEIPYGSTAYGIESASQTFLNKSAKDLTIAEGALLAALPQSPSYYLNHEEDLLQRQQLILKLLRDQEKITEEQYTQAKEEKVAIQAKRESITAPHFVFYVRELLANRYGEKIIEQGGLKVVTTLDIDHQRSAESAITKGVERNTRYGAENAALVSLDTKTGQILAMVGSKDYFDESIDGNVNVTLRPNQPGSSFKPIVYATAFKKGYTPETMLFDFATKFKTDSGDYEPKNYDGGEHGPVTMRQALAGSLNIPAVQTLYLAGIPNVLDTAKDLGYTTLNDPSRFGLSLVLGGGDVTLLEHTSAFATFAREGQRHPPTPILRIEDKNGRVLEEFEQHETTAIEQQVAQQITDILTDNGARAYIFGTRNSLTLPDRPVAAKTGTTNDFRDAWTMGYTPSIAVGVWVGNNDNSEMKKGADGSVIAAPIWQTYLKDVLKDSPVETFHKPKAEKTDKPILQGKIEGEEKILVDRVTGKRIPSSCKDTYPKDFVTEKTYNDIHSILYYVDKDNPRGPIPEHPEKDLQFDRFEEPVRKWAEKNGTLTTIPSDESCSLRSQTNQPVVTIVSPAIGETVSGSSMTVTIESASTRAMKRVEYYIDNEKIGTSAALTSSVNIDGLTTGFHTLEVVVFDDVENSGSALRDINYLPVVESTPVSE